MAKKYAVIVGFGPGNGVGIASAFGAAGYALALISRNPAKQRDQTLSLVQAGHVAESFQADASDPASVKAAFAAAAQKFGGDPDVVVYNAMAMTFDPVSTIPPETLVNDLKTNVVGALVTAQTVLPAMKARKSGSILFTGGGWALFPSAAAASPSIGKAALRTLAIVLNEDLQGSGVKVGTLTIMGSVKVGTPFDPVKIGAAFLAMHNAPANGFTAEVQFKGA